MAIHPWTMYEIARMRDEERLTRARSAMLAREIREAPRSDPEAAMRSRGRSGRRWMRSRHSLSTSR
jgi:hypothetical protein